MGDTVIYSLPFTEYLPLTHYGAPYVTVDGGEPTDSVSYSITQISAVDLPGPYRDEPGASGILYTCLTLLLFIAYALLLRYFRHYIAFIFDSFKSPGGIEKVVNEQSRGFALFRSVVITLFILSVSLCVVKFFGLPAPLAGRRWLLYAVVPAAAAAVTAVIFFQRMAVSLATALTYTPALGREIMVVRSVYLSCMVVTAVPVLLLAALNPYPSARVFLYICTGIAALAFGGIMVQTLILFLRQKISILTWFLYLCAVEIFPYSIIIFALLRQMR